ncbi:hypothetical protein BB560_003291 [Smittium megazygosporum]|uniref:Cytochrome b5 heme-binding domain-containing protein n=1 Tax=Smittium megazygosporum TaxID=133381 RepID=A0A2T9ZCE9_9FUNG|nr:hypothetical protein BB560_003291 [Smittium megazygosporum]
MEKYPYNLPRLEVNKELPVYTCQEFRERILDGEYLVIFDGYILKLNSLISNHPGGPLAVFHAVGKDATDEMRAMHPDIVVSERMHRYVVAKYAKDEKGVSFVEDLKLTFSKPTPVDSTVSSEKPIDYEAAQEDYRKLMVFLRDNKFFECNYMHYYKEMFRLACLAFGIFAFILWFGKESTLKVVLSACCASIFWQQAAFCAHDLGHSAVTANRTADTRLGIILGGVFGGLSVGWWKKSHNVHHIVTNQPENDPDIQHLPFFAISPVFVNNLTSTYYEKTLVFDRASEIFVSMQDRLYYIILIFGRFNLYAESWKYLLGKGYVPFRYTEFVSLPIFWMWYLWLLSHLSSWKLMLIHLLVSHGVSSILHIQITLSHFGMPVTSPDPKNETFIARQVRTSMNVDCHPLVDWFHGGLQFQIEHHLFPRLPRHNLRNVRPYVKELCKKHNINYIEEYFIDGNIFVLKKLRETADFVKLYISSSSKS